MFTPKNKIQPIGLDISDNSLKLVQLKTSKNRTKIQALGKINLPNNLISNGVINNKEEVIRAIKKIISNPIIGSFNTDNVVACLPETKTYIKLIEVEKSPNPLSTVIENEIEKHFPLSLKNTYYDWQIIKETEDLYLVSIGACQKNTVNEYIELLENANLSVVGLEIESTAISRALLPHKTKQPQNYGIIDIGAQRTSMIINCKNAVTMSIKMPISGNQITNEIANKLNINNNQAEKAKIICGLDKDKAEGIIREILSNTISKLIKKINKTISFFYNTHSNYGKIDQIIICGGGAKIKNIDKIINKKTSIKTTIADPLCNINEKNEKILKKTTETYNLIINNEKTNNKTKKQNSIHSYTTAIGLALKNSPKKEYQLNIIPDELKKEIKDTINYNAIKNLAFIVFLSLISYTILLTGGLITLNSYHSITINQTGSINEHTKKYNTKILNLNHQLQSVEKIQKDFTAWSRLIINLANNTNENLTFSSIKINKETNTIDIKGHANSRNALLSLKQQLEANNHLKNVILPTKNLFKKEDIIFDISATFSSYDFQ